MSLDSSLACMLNICVYSDSLYMLNEQIDGGNIWKVKFEIEYETNISIYINLMGCVMYIDVYV